ncbi:MAG: ABC transporter permease [Candidatus Puniceispirillaceae bacterium]
MIYLEPRSAVSTTIKTITPLLAIGITVILGGIIFATLGYDALEALSVFFIQPLSRPDQIADLFVKACPLIIIGVGLVFCYRANIWNIGAEGQLVLGAIGAGWVALSFPDATSPLILVPMALAAMAFGAFWGFIPALLRVRFQTNEILVSLMLTYVATLLIDWLVRGPWRNPMSFGFPLTKLYPDAALIPVIDLPGIGRLGQLHMAVPFALLLAIIAWFILQRSLAGYQVRLMGLSPRAVRFAGFLPDRITLAVMMASGALAGLAGAIEVSANIGQLQPNISFGYGFTAIIVAFLARLNPMAVIIAGLVVALAELGGDSAQIALGIPKVVTGLFKGLLLFMLLAGETITHYRIRLK